MSKNEVSFQHGAEVIPFPSSRIRPAVRLLGTAAIVIDLEQYRQTSDFTKKRLNIASDIDEQINVLWHFHSRSIDDQVTTYMADAGQLVANVIDPDSNLEDYMKQLLDGLSLAEVRYTLLHYKKVLNCLEQAYELIVTQHDEEQFFKKFTSKFSQDEVFVHAVSVIAQLAHVGLREVMPSTQAQKAPFEYLQEEYYSVVGGLNKAPRSSV